MASPYPVLSTYLEETQEEEYEPPDPESEVDFLGLYSRLHPTDSGLFSVLPSKIKNKNVLVALPLRKVEVDIQAIGPAAQMVTSQTFLNPTEANLEVEYIWPLSPDCSVSKVEIVLLEDQKRLKGILLPRRDAQEKYEKAKAEGKFVGKVNQSSDQILRLQIGNLLPSRSVVVSISQVVLTTFRDPDVSIQKTGKKKPSGEKQYMLRIPTYISPRYQTDRFRKIGSEEDTEEFVPVYLQPTKSAVSASPKIDFNVKLFSATKIQNISSTSHPSLLFSVVPLKNPRSELPFSLIFQNVPISNSTRKAKERQEEENLYGYKVGGLNELQMDKDFVLSWNIETPLDTGLSTVSEVNQDMKTISSLVTFIPGLLLGEGEENEKKSKSRKIGNQEYVFVLDRSGSMEGDRIANAKNALLLFLQSLPDDSSFNVVSFGSTFSLLFRQSVETTDENLKIAAFEIKKMKADLGGTEITDALAFLLTDKGNKKIQGKTKTKTKAKLKQIFILTDGDIYSGKQVIEDTIAKAPIFARIFTLGIGDSANQIVLQEFAEAGRGTSRTVSDSNIQNLKAVVIELLELSQTKSVTKVHFEFYHNGTLLSPDNYAPKQLSSLFPWQAYALGVVVPIGTSMKNLLRMEMKVEIYDNEKEDMTFEKSSFEWTLQSKGGGGRQSQEKKILLPILGHLLMKELQRNQITNTSSVDYSKKMLQLSLKTGVLSPETAFFLVDEETAQKDLTQAQLLQQISMQNPTVLSTRSAFSNVARQKSYLGSTSARPAMSAMAAPAMSQESKRSTRKQGQKQKETEKADSVVEIALVQSREGWFDVKNLNAEVSKRIQSSKETKSKFQQFLSEWTSVLSKIAEDSEEKKRILNTFLILSFLWFSLETREAEEQWKLVSERAETWLSKKYSIFLKKPGTKKE